MIERRRVAGTRFSTGDGFLNVARGIFNGVIGLVDGICYPCWPRRPLILPGDAIIGGGTATVIETGRRRTRSSGVVCHLQVSSRILNNAPHCIGCIWLPSGRRGSLISPNQAVGRCTAGCFVPR